VGHIYLVSYVVLSSFKALTHYLYSHLRGAVPAAVLTGEITCQQSRGAMHLYYYMNDEGKRVYTLKKKDPEGKPTCSAHPGIFCLQTYP
jgi:hypothetical protein